MVKNFLSFDKIKDPSPGVTAEIVAKIKLLEHEGHSTNKMSLFQIISHGVDTRDWEKDKQN